MESGGTQRNAIACGTAIIWNMWIHIELLMQSLLCTAKVRSWANSLNYKRGNTQIFSWLISPFCVCIIHDCLRISKQLNLICGSWLPCGANVKLLNDFLVMEIKQSDLLIYWQTRCFIYFVLLIDVHRCAGSGSLSTLLELHAISHYKSDRKPLKLSITPSPINDFNCWSDLWSFTDRKFGRC